MPIEPKNPDYKEVTAQIFREAAFIQALGIEPVEIEPGRVVSRLVPKPMHMQHDKVIHAGVQATMADHTAGGAAFTVIPAGQIVLTVNFLVNLMQVGIAEELRCDAHVLRAGKRLVVAESEVFALNAGKQKLISKATVTLAVLDKPD
jgi:uncharacterized protein (TIGR00369 family)